MKSGKTTVPGHTCTFHTTTANTHSELVVPGHTCTFHITTANTGSELVVPGHTCTFHITTANTHSELVVPGHTCTFWIINRHNRTIGYSSNTQTVRQPLLCARPVITIMTRLSIKMLQRLRKTVTVVLTWTWWKAFVYCNREKALTWDQTSLQTDIIGRWHNDLISDYTTFSLNALNYTLSATTVQISTCTMIQVSGTIHTWPTKTPPVALWMKISSFIPSSYGGYFPGNMLPIPGSYTGCIKTAVTTTTTTTRLHCCVFFLKFQKFYIWGRKLLCTERIWHDPKNLAWRLASLDHHTTPNRKITNKITKNNANEHAKSPKLSVV